MRKFRALVILNLKAMLSSFRFGGKKKRAASGLGVLVLMAFLALYLSGSYSFLIAAQFAPIGMLELLIMMMPVLAVAIGLIFTLFAAQGVIFGGRDNDLMLSLPIPAFTLMLSRTLALYVENLVFTVFVMAPAGVAYLAFGGGGGAAFFVVLLLCSLFLALLPTLLSMVIGFVLAWVSSKFSKRALLSNLLYVGAFVLLMVVIMRLQFAMGDLAQYAMGIKGAFSGWGTPFLLLTQAACEGNLLSLLLFLLLCLGPFLLVVWLFAGRYKKIITGLTAKGARSDYKLERVSATGCRRALLNKEAKKFFGTPIYLMNAGMGLVLLVLGSVAALVFQSSIAEFLNQMGDLAQVLPIMPLLTVSMCFMVSMTGVTASSISLEGRQLWILKSAPISAKGIFTIKVGFHMLLVTPCVLVSTVCLTAAFSLGIADALLMFLAAFSVGLFTALLGLFANLCMPKLDAPNDMVVVKQSGSVMVTMLGSMLLVILAAALCAMVSGVLGWTLAILLPIAFYLLGSGLLGGLIMTRGTRMFQAL